MSIEEKLNKPLDPSLVKERSQAGRTFAYIEGARAIDQANQLFGYDGWSLETMELEQVAQYQQRDRHGNEQYVVTYVARARVKALGVYRDGVGASTAFSTKLSDAIEQAAKGAETDAIKRALRTFGPQFGLHLYFGEETAAPASHDSPAPTSKPNIANPDEPASEKQIGYIRSLMRGVKIPKEHADGFLQYLTAGEPLTKGEASNIIDIFKKGEWEELWKAYAADNAPEELF